VQAHSRQIFCDNVELSMANISIEKNCPSLSKDQVWLIRFIYNLSLSKFQLFLNSLILLLLLVIFPPVSTIDKILFGLNIVWTDILFMSYAMHLIDDATNAAIIYVSTKDIKCPNCLHCISERNKVIDMQKGEIRAS
jgi:hypothetical protein